METRVDNVERAQHTTYEIHITYSFIYAMCDDLDSAKVLLAQCTAKNNGEGYIVEQTVTTVTKVHRPINVTVS